MSRGEEGEEFSCIEGVAGTSAEEVVPVTTEGGGVASLTTSLISIDTEPVEELKEDESVDEDEDDEDDEDESDEVEDNE